MNHKKQFTQKQSYALTTVATLAIVILASAFSFPVPKNTSQASKELDLTAMRQLCSGITEATTAYGNCLDAADALAAKRTPPQYANLSPAYKPLGNCREAVDYIFNDRVDYPRAVKVVFRESTNNPNARRPGSQYAGCAQLSSTLQRIFLKGPWNDPYFNVLALRDAVDSPAWGWCHWDLVNYCKPGGEF